MTLQQVLARLEKFVAEAGSQQAAAKRLGVHGSYLSDVRRGNRKPGRRVLLGLGLARVDKFEPVEKVSA